MKQLHTCHTRHTLICNDNGNIIVILENFQRLLAGISGEYLIFSFKGNLEISEINLFIINI